MDNKPFGFIIPGRPVPKKNSSILVKGHAVILPSKAYQTYERHVRDVINTIHVKQRLPHYSGAVRMQVKYYLPDYAHWPDLVGLMQATADILSDEYRVIDHKKRLVCKWLLSDDRIIKNWDGSCIAGIDKVNPRAEIVIVPLDIDIESELDPYIKRQLIADNALFGG